MTYTVVWMPAAQQQLAALWLAARNQTAVTRASDRIDRLLVVDPETEGDVRFDSVYSLIVWPLGVEFEIQPDDRLVHVLSVWDALAGEPDPTGN
jgi:hypothetical protein